MLKYSFAGKHDSVLDRILSSFENNKTTFELTIRYEPKG
jgi:hypothetical protein